MADKPAIVLLSGGLDSATVLAMARTDGFACHALSFDYGQRHRIGRRDRSHLPGCNPTDGRGRCLQIQSFHREILKDRLQRLDRSTEIDKGR